MTKLPELIDAYLYRMGPNGPEYLALLRASHKIYAGQWRMIGGKVDPGETYWQAAYREIQEETQLTPSPFWTVPTVNQFYNPKHDVFHKIPIFAGEIDVDADPILDDEHTDYRWVSAGDIETFFLWPEQQRIVHAIDGILRNGTIVPQWLIEPS
jgi:dihydroneopterin triphosphate diphosphatase